MSQKVKKLYHLGFILLAILAYQHELKSKENDINYVNDNYNILMNELNKILYIAKKHL